MRVVYVTCISHTIFGRQRAQVKYLNTPSTPTHVKEVAAYSAIAPQVFHVTVVIRTFSLYTYFTIEHF